MNYKPIIMDAARAFAQSNDELFHEFYSGYQLGVIIPPSTHIEVTFKVVHEPDKQVTPILEDAVSV